MAISYVISHTPGLTMYMMVPPGASDMKGDAMPSQKNMNVFVTWFVKFEGSK